MKKKINKKVIIIISIIAAVLIIGCGLILYFFWPSDKPIVAETIDSDDFTFNISTDISLSGMFSYSGPFVEDGSDENVENIAAVKIKNIGDKDYEYVEFNVTANSTVYYFEVSSLKAGTTITVLNKDKTAFSSVKFDSAELSSKAEYIEPVSMCEDKFELYTSENTVNIKNITDKDFTGTVTVYFKQVDENGYFGGITYRSKIEGIKSGEIKQMISDHFGEVVNITYEE